jgi:hypothetical protein
VSLVSIESTPKLLQDFDHYFKSRQCMTVHPLAFVQSEAGSNLYFSQSRLLEKDHLVSCKPRDMSSSNVPDVNAIALLNIEPLESEWCRKNTWKWQNDIECFPHK